MKIKVYVIDFEVPTRIKRIIGKRAVRIGVPLGVLLCGGALAWAGGLPKTWSSGDVLQASDLNGNFAYLQGEIATLQGQITTSTFTPRTPSAFLAQLTTSVDVPAATILPLVFDNTIFDLDNEYDPMSGKFTPKAPGVYLITCAVSWETTADMEVQSAILLKNGVDLDGTDLVAGGQGVTFMRPEVTTIAELGTTDYVQCATYQGTTTDAYTDNSRPDRDRFAATRLY